MRARRPQSKAFLPLTAVTVMGPKVFSPSSVEIGLPNCTNYPRCKMMRSGGRKFCKGASIYDVRRGRGRGSSKSRQKEQNQLICDSDKRGSKNPKNFADVISGSPLAELQRARAVIFVRGRSTFLEKLLARRMKLSMISPRQSQIYADGGHILGCTTAASKYRGV